MRRAFISFFLAALLSICASSQNSQSISAQVVDGTTGEPVEYACISNLYQTIGSMADADGRFTLTESDLALGHDEQEKKSTKNSSMKSTIKVGVDSLVISRIGYQPMTLGFDQIQEIIYLKPSPNTLQSVTIVPKKKKTLGDLYIPNPIQKKAYDLVSKYDFMHQVNHRIESEFGRPFKFKNDSRINKIRLSIHENDSVTVILNVYRKVDDEWVNIHDDPIVVEVPASDDWRNVVEVDVSQILEPQPKGEYLIALAKRGDGKLNLWARQPITVDGRQRIVGTNKWKRTDPVPGIEIDIEY